MSLTITKPIQMNNLKFESGTEVFNSLNEKVIDTEFNTIINKNNGFFTENQGQIRNGSIHYYIQGKGVWFTDDGVMFEISNEIGAQDRDSRIIMNPKDFNALPEPIEYERVILTQKFVGANNIVPVGKGLLPHNSNFFYGNDSSKWCTDVPNYEEIIYENLYEDIDLRYYNTNKGLKYDFIVNPGGDPNNIILQYEGAEELFINPTENLVIHTPLGEIIDSELFIYQEKEDIKNKIEGKYKIIGPISFGFEIISNFDWNKTLIIDPLLYSTYIGGSNDDYGNDIGIDSSGNIYIVGSTNSIDYPNTTAANDTTYNGLMDVFVLKINPGTSTLVYSTFIGGASNDEGNAIQIDSGGNAYVAGSTFSSDFPVTSGVYDDTHNFNHDVFVLKLSSNGASLLFSTFVGASDGDRGNDIAVDSTGNVYIVGSTWSTAFPISPGAFDSSWDTGWEDAFFTKLDSTGSSLLYSTFIGGHGYHDKGKGIAVDAAGNAYITGETWSAGYPVKSGSFDTNYNGEGDAFITVLNPAGTGPSDLVYSTFIGGNDNDYGYDITLDSDGDIYITGFTESADFPYTPGAYDTIQNGGIDVFVLKLNPAGASSSDLIYSTFIGGSISQWGAGIVLDNGGNAYISGPTISNDFPITPGSYDDIHNGNWDGFVIKLDPTGSTLLYSTFFGGTNEDVVNGIAIDDYGNVFTTGYTVSIDFPLTQDALDPTFNANKDIFTLKLNLTRFYVSDIGISESYVYRNNSVIVYANSSHTYDIEPDLQPYFEYCAPGEYVWCSDYFSNLEYNNSRWEVQFKPQVNATLGLYDFRVRLSDTKMLFTRWAYFNDSLTVKNNHPKMEDISLSENTAILGDSISIWINCSDIEEPEIDLTIELEYMDSDQQAWNTTNLDNLKYLQNRWECNLMISFNIPFGNINFRARLNDSDGNYSSWLYHNDSLLIYNTPPKVIDIKLSDSVINRTGSMFLYVNSSDHETDEAMLKPFFQYKHENSNDWSDLTMKYSDATSSWKFKFNTDEESITGSYDFRVRFEDAELLTCEWVYLNDSFKVQNNRPSVVDIKISKPEVLRNNSIIIYVNGSDIEDPENLLLCEAQYQLPSEAWVELDDFIYQDGRWQVEFIVPVESALGKYDLEVNFIDSDNDYSGWTTIEDAFEVKNNIPTISNNLDDIEIGFYPESFDLTSYGFDIEDEVEDLSWSIDQSTVDTTLFQATIIIAPGNILHIIPWDNVTGEDDITLSLNDKDGGVVTKSDITLQVNSILTLVTPKVTLLSPLDNSVVNTLTPMLDWTLNYNGTKLITYSILIDENPDPQTELKAGITTTSFTFENDLENHKTYYWKVIPKGGICLSDPFSFTVDLGFFPYYEVYLTLEKYDLTLKPGDSATINLTVENIGNVNDIYIIKLNVDNLIEYIDFSILKDVALQPTYSETQRLFISLAKNAPKGEVNITIIATSFYGGEAVNNSKLIQIDIEPEVYSGVDGGRKLETVILFIWAIIIIIIIIGIVIAAILKKHKQKSQAELAAQEKARVGVELSQLPSVSSVQGSAPQLSAAGHPGPPTPILGASAGLAASRPPPTPQIAQPEVRPQLPPAQLGVGASGQAQQGYSQKLPNEQKLKLLEERFLKGDIDQATYIELRSKYETAIDVQLSQDQPRLPPAPAGAVSEPTPEPLGTNTDGAITSSDASEDSQKKCPKCNSVLIINSDGSTSCIKCEAEEELRLKKNRIQGGDES